MKKLSISLIALIFATPSFATGIDAGANSAGCNNGVLGTYEGSSNLQAQWTANTIHLNWYNDSVSNNGTTITPTNSAAGTCSYDGAITLPTNTMTKEGYTFAGWRVRAAAQQTTFDLTTLFGPNANSICTGGDAFYGHGEYNNTDICFAFGPGTVNSSSPEVCTTESGMSDIEIQQWKVTFGYGTVKGQSYCSGKSGDNHGMKWGGNSADWSATESELTSAVGEAKYCWCKTIGFAEPNSSTYHNISSSSWVSDGGTGYQDADTCKSSCAPNCALGIYVFASFRGAMFGVDGADQCEN